jgi:hypothetical protein
MFEKGARVLRKKSFSSILIGCILLPQLAHSAQNYLNGHVGALSNQFNQNVGNVPGNRYNADLLFDYYRDDSTSFSRGLERRFTFAALVNDQNLTMYSLSESYVGGKLTSKDGIRFGRQILNWSTVDSTWGFGKLNNRRNFDYLEPGQEGLTGLLYERKSTNGMRYRAFVSGLYVPEMNPSLDIDKDQKTINSRHAWGMRPAQTAEVEGQDKRILYDVAYPELADVVYRYTVGANIGWESKHWVFDSYVMRKPENQLSTQVEVAYNAGDDVIKAFITPQIYYHDLFGANLRYRNQDIEVYVSGIGIRPNTYPDGNVRATRFTEIKTEKIREDYVGGGIMRSNDLFAFGVNYVARLSPFDRDRDTLVEEPRWNQAVNLFFARNIGKSYRISGDFKYDMLTLDRLTMLRAQYNVSKDLQMNVGVNIIGTPENGRSFWSPYTNNDAIFGGMRYIF